jgi:hypothetical protein
MLSRTYRRLGKWSLKKEWAIALALSVTGSRMESRAPKIRRCTRTLALVTGHMQMVAAGNIPPFPSVHVFRQGTTALPGAHWPRQPCVQVILEASRRRKRQRRLQFDHRQRR